MISETKSDLPKISIFNFESYRDFLIAVGMPDGLYSHTSNNLLSWANRLGYKSPSSLSMVLKGQRFPSFDMINALSKDLDLNYREREYFELLIQLEKAKNKGRDTSKILEKIKNIPIPSDTFTMSLKEFSSISEWYYFVIKQLIDTPDFRNDDIWIYKKLRKKVQINQIRQAINDMLDMKIISRDENDKLTVVRQGLITTNDVPSQAIKKHHFGMINRAIEAIEEQNVNRRQISSMTLKINKSTMTEAKQSIFNFLKDFNEKYSSHESSDLYQLNLQFFSHTKEITEQ